MGCVCSKRALSATASPAFEYSVARRDNGSVVLEPTSKIEAKSGESLDKKEESEDRRSELSTKSTKSSHRKLSINFRLGNSYKYVESEHVAAGWPAWLSAQATEAIHGWLPLRPDSFEKLEKIGQGTYSSVFRARNVETGKIVALKKVRFDNFQPESIRFMAREIMILRRLDHPNIMKLEGVITSRLSYSIYLVFEYMEHDLAGLVSCPDIKFSDSQIKCYMQQLLSGVEHCHMRGIMHRDIKASNILINNEGVLKVADFGLANTLSSKNRQPLTSHVVTLWYRPPELLLGSTDYGVSVDLWSVGCVFAEILVGRPILKGRTEVEQLHKIFKLCGSPPDEFWTKSKLPLATMFKPQHPYESTLRERCKEFPTTAVNLIETFLSIDPNKRGTASSALNSEYFTTKPFACDPSSLPKYPPNKEIDAKSRDEAKRKKVGMKGRGLGPGKKARRVPRMHEQKGLSKLTPIVEEVQPEVESAQRNSGGNGRIPKGRGEPLISAFDTESLNSQMTTATEGDIPYSNPVPVVGSSGAFAWAKRRKDDSQSTRSYNRSSTRSHVGAIGPMSVSHITSTLDSDEHHNSYKIARRPLPKQRIQFDQPDSSEAYEAIISKVRKEQKEAMSSQSNRLDELMQKNESQTGHAIRRSRLQRGG